MKQQAKPGIKAESVHAGCTVGPLPATNPIETTLGALREMAQLDNKYLAIPPALAEFILDNGFRHDDTAVMLAPGAVWIAGER